MQRALFLLFRWFPSLRAAAAEALDNYWHDEYVKHAIPAPTDITTEPANLDVEYQVEAYSPGDCYGLWMAYTMDDAQERAKRAVELEGWKYATIKRLSSNPYEKVLAEHGEFFTEPEPERPCPCTGFTCTSVPRCSSCSEKEAVS